MICLRNYDSTVQWTISFCLVRWLVYPDQFYPTGYLTIAYQEVKYQMDGLTRSCYNDQGNMAIDQSEPLDEVKLNEYASHVYKMVG